MAKKNAANSFKDYCRLALETRKHYTKLEQKNCGRNWTKEEIAQGFVVDVGDLMKEVMKQAGLRGEKNRATLSHELCDCLWSIFVLADKYKIDLAEEFPKNMEILQAKVKDKLKQK
ncbi:MAG: nucleotide pyrophosphohydrolase [Candidatus Falkowbacteria bacterium]|nr:nucleotide pyrophosphohydrolase [Candidatus Falkowbacteria bacterium]